MTSMNSSGVLSSLNSTSALKISDGGVKGKQTRSWLNVEVRSSFYLKDTVLVKNELDQFLRAVGERNRGVVGEAATFLGLP